MHVGGNFIVMPILVLVLFGFNVWMLKIPYPQTSEIRGAHYTNICETQDTFSYAFFIGFQVVALLTYVPIFYYLVTTCMLM